MLYLIGGLPGAGKSFYATLLAESLLNKNIDVFSNILTNDYYFKYKKRHGKFYFFKNKTDIRLIYNGAVIIDESPDLYYSRAWQSFSPDDASKFRQHRKDKLDMYIVSQNIEMIDVNIRRLSQWYLEVSKVSIYFLGHELVLFFKITKLLPEDYKKAKAKIYQRKFIFSQFKIRRIYKAYDTYRRLNFDLTKIDLEKYFKKQSYYFTKDKLNENINI